MTFYLIYLRVSEDYKYNITPHTRIQGDFLIEHDRLHNGSIEFRELNGNEFALILRDADEQIMTVSLKERIYFTRTVYLMNGERYKELQSLSDEFEESIKSQLRMQDNTVKMILFALEPLKMTAITIKTIKTLNTKTEGHNEEEETVMMTFYSG